MVPAPERVGKAREPDVPPRRAKGDPLGPVGREPDVPPWGQREGKPGSWLPLWPFRPSQETVQRWNFKRHSNLCVYVPFNALLFLMLMLNVYVFNFVANVNRMCPVCFSYFYSFWEGAGFHGRLLLVM